MGQQSMAPIILNFGKTQRCVVNFRSLPLDLQERNLIPIEGGRVSLRAGPDVL